MTEAVRVDGICKRFGAVIALAEVSLRIEAGEFFALLGPSGCGKSTLLRIMAGLEHPDRGSVFIDGIDVGRTPANRRPVNMVFQSYALFPHMSVRSNVAYGLRVTGTGRAEAHERAEAALGLVRLAGYGERMPDQLSGGESQRVALARALVKRPRVLLLDEPLSALDARLRDEMRLELVSLQKTVGITFIIVTHDQEEALSMADRVAVMEAGSIRQVAPPAELYEAPADRFVATFIGQVNLFPATVEADGIATAHPFPGVTAKSRGTGAAHQAWIAVRPEKITMAPGGSTPAGRLSGVVEEVVYRGGLSLYLVRCMPGPDGLVRVSRANAARTADRLPGPGAEVVLDWPEDCAVVLAS